MGKLGFFELLLLVALLFAGTTAWAGPKLATVLPSRVKTITLEPVRTHSKKQVAKKKSHGKKKVSKAKAIVTPPMTSEEKLFAELKARNYSEEIQQEARDNLSSNGVYVSKAIYWVKSSAPLDESYNCDFEVENHKKQEAEIQAKAECQSSGRASECRVAKVIIAKSGQLDCPDFPGRRCPGKGYYRGCVAEALVVGEQLERQAANE